MARFSGEPEARSSKPLTPLSAEEEAQMREWVASAGAWYDPMDMDEIRRLFVTLDVARAVALAVVT